jgi:hypothetical protein
MGRVQELVKEVRKVDVGTASELTRLVDSTVAELQTALDLAASKRGEIWQRLELDLTFDEDHLWRAGLCHQLVSLEMDLHILEEQIAELRKLQRKGVMRGWRS